MDDDVETTNLSQTEFSLLNTSSVNLFPDPNSLSERARRLKVIILTGCYLPYEHFQQLLDFHQGK